MTKYAIICVREWKVLGYVEAETPLDAMKEGMVKFNNSNVVAVSKDFSTEE